MAPGKFVLHSTKQRKGQATYVYYMIAWYYRKNHKPIRHILKYLGRLSPEEVSFYKTRVAYLNQSSPLYPCHMDQLCVRESKAYLPCAVGLHLWDQWRLSEVFTAYDAASQADVPLADMAKILTILRCVRPCSKRLSTEVYRETCLPLLTGVPEARYNPTRVFRALTPLEQHREALGRHIFTQARHHGQTQGDVVFYDLSSSNISGLRCVLAKWGHCKDGYQTHVVLVLVITREGYPLYWDVLEGNTVEVQTLQRVFETIERLYGRLNAVVCFDRGLVSDENLHWLATHHIQFITVLDRSQLGHFEEVLDGTLFQQVRACDITTQATDIQRLLTAQQFRQAASNLYYKPVTMTAQQQRRIEQRTTKLQLDTRRYVVAFNPELAAITHRHRQQRVAAFFEWIDTYNQELAGALGSRSPTIIDKTITRELKRRRLADVPMTYTLSSFVVTNQNAQGISKRARTYRITLNEVRPHDYTTSRTYDGVWVLVTNLTPQDEATLVRQTDLDSCVDVYRLRQRIEESFRILSDVVEVEPFHVYTTPHIKAHFTICVLAYVVEMTMLRRIRQAKEVKNMDLHRLLHLLDKCKQDCIQLDETHVVSKLTQLTEEQQTLLKVLECHHVVSPDYLQRHQIVSEIATDSTPRA